MTGHALRGSDEVFPLQTLAKDRVSCAETIDQERPYQHAAYVSYSVRPDGKNHRKVTALYGTMATSVDARSKPAKATPRPTETDSLLGSSDPHNNQSETESDSDGSCSYTAANSLQSILRSSSEYSCRSLKKQASVEFALDIDSDDDSDVPKLLEGSCASRCMPRRLTIEEKAALYQVRPDLELVPTIYLMSELEEMRRQRQRKLMFSILGASLIMLMMLMFYYLVSQM
ncbi:hypothetical protein PHYBOEH_008286 [Phytophthora boehmeriae]|uniref:Uncharacterized protein n=1 Tax=Phytophthora boehmeriae TaxID=109152 RepID=A0A8T1X6I1_9STRA|nr:hypothetical protein PHYBOEH_008286 [Phytophthora boehmeriae]